MKLPYEDAEHFLLLAGKNGFLGLLRYIFLSSVLVTMLFIYLPAMAHDNLSEAFRIYGDGQGGISFEKVKIALSGKDFDLSEEELDQMMAEIDTDDSGVVDFDEFETLMME